MNQWEKGKRAEQLASEYLKQKGYTIWKRNWRSGRKELDLVALHNGELIIVEVKARQWNAVNEPAEVIDPQKQMHLLWCTEAFIRVHGSNRPTRFDVVAVIYHRNRIEIQHIENAFIPSVE